MVYSAFTTAARTKDNTCANSLESAIFHSETTRD